MLMHMIYLDLKGKTAKIGPLFKGRGKEARESYIEGIAKVLLNMKKYLIVDYDVFL